MTSEGLIIANHHRAFPNYQSDIFSSHVNQLRSITPTLHPEDENRRNNSFYKANVEFGTKPKLNPGAQMIHDNGDIHGTFS